MNRFKLQQLADGIKAELQASNKKLEDMYTDTTSTAEMRAEQMKIVKDLEERYDGIKNQIMKLDQAAGANLGAQTRDSKEKRINAKAELIRSTMQRRKADPTKMAALIDDSATGGDKFLPKTVANEILTEPFVKNPLREASTFTAITNLEVPKLNFTLDDDDFVTDGATAKELEAKGSNVSFGRHKFKVFCDVSETTLKGTNTALVATVESGLRSGLAAKEKKVAFATAPKSGEEHMSFYKKTSTNYDIKAVKAANKLQAIKAAIADLHEDYRENAKVCMTYADYLDIIESLANGNATLYAAQPEQILGKPAFFCDSATVPIVGDFSYSHFNYDLDVQYETDKNIKTGMNSFVLTAWIDHQIKLLSAFRLAVVSVE